MLKGFVPGKIYLATGFTDLRKGIDGLAGIVQEQFQLDAFDDALFLFCGRRTDRIKGLYWDSNGFLLLYKRLEQGRFCWPRSEQEARLITMQQYEWLCNGFEIEARNKRIFPELLYRHYDEAGHSEGWLFSMLCGILEA